MIIESLKLCVPVESPEGLQSCVCEHFGRAPYHIAVDVNTGEFETIKKENDCDDHSHGHCMPVETLIAHDIKLVACKGLGRGALNRLMQNEIAVFSTKASTVEEVIQEYRNKNLSAVSEQNVCKGHH